MATPVIVQAATSVQASLTSAVNTATLPGTATAGNLLLFYLAGDKNTGTLTLSDDGDDLGWTVEVSLPTASVSLYVAWKVADGGEQQIVGTTSSTPSTGNNGWCAELSQTGSGGWGVVAISTNSSNGTTSISSSNTGTTGAATDEGLALAAAAIDSLSSISGTPSWTNSYSSELAGYEPSGSGGGNGGLFVASLPLADGATTNTTFATNGGSDQISTAVVAFGREAVAAAVPATGTGALALSGTATAAKVIAAGGSGDIGLATTGTAVKVATQGGSCSFGSPVTGTAKKVGLGVGVATLGLSTAHDGSIERAQGGSCSFGLAGAGGAAKVVAAGATAALGLSGHWRIGPDFACQDFSASFSAVAHSGMFTANFYGGSVASVISHAATATAVQHGATDIELCGR